MAFIEPMHRNKPNITYLLTYLLSLLQFITNIGNFGIETVHTDSDAMSPGPNESMLPKSVIFYLLWWENHIELQTTNKSKLCDAMLITYKNFLVFDVSSNFKLRYFIYLCFTHLVPSKSVKCRYVTTTWIIYSHQGIEYYLLSGENDPAKSQWVHYTCI